ncbi:MAG TPA: DUF3047 domain-containing protein, partial [Acidimicrobiales bacterium]
MVPPALRMTSRQAFRHHFTALLADTPRDAIADHVIVELDVSTPPWMDTGLSLHAGDQITVLLCGRVYLDEAADLWLDPELQVWARVGGRGPIVRGTRASNTFTSAHDGNVELGNVNPGEWLDHDGAIGVDPGLYGFMAGGRTVAILRWAPGVDPAPALERLGSDSDIEGLLAGEAERLQERAGNPPKDWEHLWYLGPSEVFAEVEPGVITCDAENTFAIICREAEMALTPETTLSWAWKVDRLPSTADEDSLPTHDYLSIAVEFDDGLDLTYQWSAGLEMESSYRCPLPHWSERETHLVVRSARSELGAWLNEERNVYTDRAAAIGGADPGRIIRVWLIAVS